MNTDNSEEILYHSPRLVRDNVKPLDNKYLIEYLEHALELAKDGELKEAVLIGKLTNGNLYEFASGSYDSHQMAGKMLEAAVIRLGFR